jgi:hypothetical protein
MTGHFSAEKSGERVVPGNATRWPKVDEAELTAQMEELVRDSLYDQPELLMKAALSHVGYLPGQSHEVQTDVSTLRR